MDSDDLTPEQAEVLYRGLVGGMSYLLRLRTRMEKAEFMPNDPVYLLVCKAYDAMHRLSVGLFLSAARLLREKLACCVLQCGYFSRKAFVGPEAFMERLDAFLKEWPAEIPLAVEIRNKAWVTPAYLDCLRSHQATLVLTDQAWMPSPLELVEKLDVVTGPFAYMRLLGDRKAVDDLTPKVDHIVIDRSRQLADDARVIKLLSKQVPVIVAVNNHFAGYSPETIRMLTEELGK